MLLLTGRNVIDPDADVFILDVGAICIELAAINIVFVKPEFNIDPVPERENAGKIPLEFEVMEILPAAKTAPEIEIPTPEVDEPTNAPVRFKLPAPPEEMVPPLSIISPVEGEPDPPDKPDTVTSPPEEFMKDPEP
jgi:hypothetical protein